MTVFGETAQNEEFSPSLEVFLGNWSDTMGHDILVTHPPQSRMTINQHMQVVLRGGRLGPTREIPLQVKRTRQGMNLIFQCGHYILEPNLSTPTRLVWRDFRRLQLQEITNIWVRAEDKPFEFEDFVFFKAPEVDSLDPSVKVSCSPRRKSILLDPTSAQAQLIAQSRPRGKSILFFKPPDLLELDQHLD